MRPEIQQLKKLPVSSRCLFAKLLHAPTGKAGGTAAGAVAGTGGT